MFRRLWQRRPTLVILGGLVLLTAPCWLPLGLLFGHGLYARYFVWTEEDRAHTGDEGLPSDARKYRAVLQSFPDFDSVTADPPNLPRNVGFFSKRFPNGEWLFGTETASHQLFGKGGTVVIRDSQGQTRIFFGHVCTLGNMQYFADGSRNLQNFYGNIQQGNLFREQFPSVTPP